LLCPESLGVLLHERDHLADDLSDLLGGAPGEAR
jgi:hypothetical protein